MSNDLSRGLFPAKDVKLLVVDEAHRAQGDYAYCQVVRELQKSDNANFRYTHFLSFTQENCVALAFCADICDLNSATSIL